MKNPAAYILILIIVLTVPAQHDRNIIVFPHVNVIDGVSSEPLRDVTVIVANGKISGIQKNPKRIPAGAEVINLRGKWLLPGYIDSHVHFENFESAQRALRFGVTTARTMGIDRFIDMEIRDARKQGRYDIPEVLAGGYQVRPDVFDAFPSFIKDFPELADMKPRVTGTANVRRLVKALASRGVDHIKLLASERAGTLGTDPRKRTFTDEEILAIVDEAKKARLKVTAHAHVDEAAAAAVRAGVTSIEHGTWLSDQTLKLMKSRGTWFVSNIFSASTAVYLNSIFPPNPILVERRLSMWPLAADATKRAHKMGVSIVGATDITYGSQFDSGRATIADNAAGLVEIGVPKMEAIKAITSKAAKLLEIDHRTGAIRKGLEADIVILGADPLSSIEALKDIRMVVNDGRVTGKEVTGSPSAMYVARVVSVNDSDRDNFLKCMQQDDLKIRQELKRKGFLSEQSVFETSSTNINTHEAPFWNFLILSRLVTNARSEDFFRAEEQLSKKSKRVNCFDGAGVETRRIEVLRTTPNSFYPHGDHSRSEEFSVRYIVEYIAVQNTPAALDEYRETMRTMLGPVQGHMIKEGSLLNFIALETASVKYSQSGMPEWNQIHVRGGNFPEKKMPSPSPGMDRTLKLLFPNSGGASVVFGRLRTIRTKPREDVARQLGDLAIR